jgi:hypothetical protein
MTATRKRDSIETNEKDAALDPVQLGEDDPDAGLSPEERAKIVYLAYPQWRNSKCV